MKPHSVNNWRVFAWALALGLVGVVGVFRVEADQWDKKTILTVDQPIQIQERLLQPGQYVFKLLNSNSDRHIVQIYNADQSHIIDTVLAIPNYRLQPTGKSQFAFWETPAGNAKALRAWFYPGDNFGQEFRYPKHLTVLEASASRTVATRTSEERATTTTQQETPIPQSAQSETVTQEANREERVETAQATPPPAVPAPAPAPTPTVQAPPVTEPPASLPKTASPYPLVGLGGALSLSLYGLLRLKRSA